MAGRSSTAIEARLGGSNPSLHPGQHTGVAGVGGFPNLRSPNGGGMFGGNGNQRCSNCTPSSLGDDTQSVIPKRSSEFDRRSEYGSSGDGCPQARRIRSSFSQEQLEKLEKTFGRSHYPDLNTRAELSEATVLSDARIQVSY